LPEEALFVSTIPPDQEQSVIILVYQYPPRTVDTDSRLELVEGGAHFIVGWYMKPTTRSPDWYPPASCVSEDKVVVVKGKPGRLLVFDQKGTRRLDRGSGDCVWWFPNLRVVSWSEPLVGGASVYWTVDNSPDSYDEAQTLDFIEAMDSVR